MYTWAIVKYSIGANMVLVPRATKMAILVEAPSTNAMKSGPASLQNKSIRRIRALRASAAINLRCQPQRLLGHCAQKLAFWVVQHTLQTCWVMSGDDHNLVYFLVS